MSVKEIEELKKEVERLTTMERSTGGSGSGAPTNAQYLALATNGTLTQERVLTPGDGLAGTDAGAGSTYTLAVNVDGTTIEINTDALRVKDGGITSAKLADGAVLAEILDDDGSGSGLDADLLDGSHLSVLLLKASNLSDVANAATSFGNIKQAATDSETGVVELATQAEVDTGTDTGRVIVPSTLTNRIVLKVKNTSGATVAAGDVGYVDEAGEFKTTTTASLIANWAVVITGGANNADIYVANRGRWLVAYTGSAPTSGQYLVTSTSAGDAQAQAYVSPAIFAVCLAAGSGGLVEVLLLCTRSFVSYFSNFYLVRTASTSTGDFVALINSGGSGGLTSTNVPYDTVSSGNENVIVPVNQGGSELGRMRLYNSTRSTYRLITAVDTALDKITTVASTDSWADNDSITIRSQTCVHPSAPPYYIDVDLSQQTEIPALATAILCQGLKTDSSATPGQFFQIHPWETFNSQKQKIGGASAASNAINTPGTVAIPLIQQRLCWRYGASGTGTAGQLLDILGYWMAAP